MKTAVSIPDDIFDRVESLAKSMRVSRSRLFSIALGEYIARHSEEEVTGRMNAVLDEVGDETDPFVDRAGANALERSVW
jgi:metal-responsive CopG/Arc/MetJ family transcriptional regulator